MSAEPEGALDWNDLAGERRMTTYQVQYHPLEPPIWVRARSEEEALAKAAAALLSTGTDLPLNWSAV